MSDLQDYMRSLNPKEEEQAILIYGSEYNLWRDGDYLGTAVWTKDDNIGDSFQKSVINNGMAVKEVYTADKWELILKQQL